VIEDALDVRRAHHAPGLLRAFNDAGVLTVADVHVARRLTELARTDDASVVLAVALAVRGPRLGHVYVDLATIRYTATVEAEEAVDLAALPWPDVEQWTRQLEQSGLAAPTAPSPEPGRAPDRPLRLDGTRLYLDRYWREEQRLAADLRAFSDSAPSDVRTDVLAEGLRRQSAGRDDGGQVLAAACAVLRRFAVVAGGPGTGKTTTVARIVALLAEQAAAAGGAAPLVALAAPTGKAAARLEEAVHAEARTLDVDAETRSHLLALEASTVHRLLGWRAGSHSRFRHHRGNRLPHDVVIVDETSMVSLSLMGRLVEAVRPEARLILVGDPGQLTSIEAGAVLGDIVGPATGGLRMAPEARRLLSEATGRDLVAGEPPAGVTVGDGIVVLERVHRYGSAIASVATAVRRGDADAAIAALTRAPDAVNWIPVDVADPDAPDALAVIRDGAVIAARTVIDAARAGDAGAAIASLGAFRLLCAHRRGLHGAQTWMHQVEGWLAAQIDGFAGAGEWYPGRPLLVTSNDYGLRLYNGDTGVVVATALDRVSAAFERGGQIAELSPSRLGAVETVYAMTVHKAQGSQFDTAAVLLPPPGSQVLTRELLYTAVTRAREHLILAGTEESVRAAVARPAARASGLRRQLWGEENR
jgi:exodeoxyribonuclease V alpha subunit